MKYCRHCGAEMKDEATVCVKCGISENTPVTSEKAYCKFCGAEMNGKAAFCTKCGVEQKNKTNFGNSFSYTASLDSKPLCRSRNGKILAGVCSGIAKKTNIHPWIIRGILIALKFLVIGWLLDIAYIIMIFVLPLED